MRRFVFTGLATNAALALILGFTYRIAFLGPVVRDRGLIDSLEGALKASFAMFFVVALASLICVVAFALHARVKGKIASAIVSGVVVLVITALLYAQVGGFHIFAGVISSISFLLLLLFVPKRPDRQFLGESVR